jgi:hypothetical protein
LKIIPELKKQIVQKLSDPEFCRPVTNQQVRDLIHEIYDAFEKESATLEQVARTIEAAKARLAESIRYVNALRNDVSAHNTGRLTEVFDRKKHTHDCHNFLEPIMNETYLEDDFFD